MKIKNIAIKNFKFHHDLKFSLDEKSENIKIIAISKKINSIDSPFINLLRINLSSNII